VDIVFAVAIKKLSSIEYSMPVNDSDGILRKEDNL
jgi:hypothetical protein